MSQVSIINIEDSHPEIPTSFITDFGTAVPIANQLEILGTTVPAGVIPVFTTGSGNTVTVNVQRTQAIGATDTTSQGLASFDSASFTVDANGFVQLIGGGASVDSIAVDAFTAPGTNPVAPSGAGVITITGAQVATGTVGANVIRSNSIAANSLTIEIQRSTMAVGPSVALNGVCHFDSTSFTVGATGFVQLNNAGFTWNDVSGAFATLENNGYFAILTATGSLPAGAAQGDTIKFFVDHATQDLTIDAAGTDLIRIGSLVSSAGGQALSTQQGDSLTLVFRAIDSQWCATDVVGTWILS